MEKTIEQLEQELAQARAKAAEAARAEREAKARKEREERLQKLTEANLEAYNSHYKADADAIVAAVAKLGYTLSYEAPNFERSYLPKFDSFLIRFTMTNQYSGRSGKPAVRVEMLESPRTYPLKQDNTFSIDKIAASFAEAVAQRQARDERREQSANRYKINEAMRKEIIRELDLSAWTSIVNTSRYYDNAVEVRLNFGKLSKDRAIELMKAVREMGFELR